MEVDSERSAQETLISLQCPMLMLRDTSRLSIYTGMNNVKDHLSDPTVYLRECKRVSFQISVFESHRT
jgi:hypothetical protein